MVLILGGGAAATLGGLLGLHVYLKKRRRDQRRERSVKNRARQFGWEMVFGPRKLRLKHMPQDSDSQ